GVAGVAGGGIAAALYLHGVKVVGNGEGPPGVQADVVVGHRGVGGVGDVHTGAVAGDEVVEHLDVGAAVDQDALVAVAHRQAAGGVGADEVARDDGAPPAVGRHESHAEEVDAA